MDAAWTYQGDMRHARLAWNAQPGDWPVPLSAVERTPVRVVPWLDETVLVSTNRKHLLQTRPFGDLGLR